MYLFRCGVLVILLAGGVAQAQNPHQYRFQNNYADDWSNLAIVPNGGTISANGYRFGIDQGLTLNDSIGSGYTMDMNYSITNFGVRSWTKIYDLSNLQLDSGFYIRYTGAYQAWPNPNIDGAPGLNTLEHLTVTRTAAGAVNVYSRGSLLGSYANDGGVLNANVNGSNKAIFFIDDKVTGQAEAGAGTITYLRIYPSALTPAQVAALTPPCIPNNIANQDATGSNSVVSQPTAQAQEGLQIYYTYAHSTNWWGQATALSLDPNTGDYNGIVWDGGCALTGGACASTGTSTTGQVPTARVIWTSNDATLAGAPLRWANISASQQASLGGASARLDYLRGVRSNEGAATQASSYRARTSVLGDIVNSGPTVVGPPIANNPDNWVDLLNPNAPQPENASSAIVYSAFAQQYAGRTSVVYTGANDGLLHGFRAGVLNSANGTTTSTTAQPNDGAEVLAYMPSAALKTIYSANSALLDYSSSSYWHNAYVDAVAGAGDLFYKNAWHTWLVGGLGPGGSAMGPVTTGVAQGALYALDVTDPTLFAESNASTGVIGDWSSNTLHCVGNATCGNSLGALYGTPVIQRTHSGKWAAFFGNGFYSSTGKAGIFAMLVDPSNGSTSFYFLDSGSTSAGNGISYVTPLDLDGDGIVDYIYAGDLAGNVWRFDVTNANPGAWSVSTPGPLFSGASNQPITTSLIVTPTIDSAGTTRVMVAFGTGQQQPATQTFQPVYATGTQAIYGVWDWNMNNWNGISGANLASLDTLPTIKPANLTAQILNGTQTANGTTYRTIAASPVCWPGSTCAVNNTYGWVIDLPASSVGTNEQVIYNPTYYKGTFIVNTAVPQAITQPTVDVTTACGPGVFNAIGSSYTLLFSLATGGPPDHSVFADNSAPITAIGVLSNGVGTPQIRQIAGQTYLYQKNLAQQATKINLSFPTSHSVKRVTYIELR